MKIRYKGSAEVRIGGVTFATGDMHDVADDIGVEAIRSNLFESVTGGAASNLDAGAVDIGSPTLATGSPEDAFADALAKAIEEDG